MKNQPIISIITVCFNSEKHIEDTIKSVLSQKIQQLTVHHYRWWF